VLPPGPDGDVRITEVVVTVVTMAAPIKDEF
jgi:hypothetical protein